MEIVTFTPDEEKEGKNKFKSYAEMIEQLGMTKEAWIIFTVASLLQFIWGCETCFISINMESLAKYNGVRTGVVSVGISILYTMMGFGSLIVGHSTKYLGRIKTLVITTVLYSFLTIMCSVIVHPLNFYYVLILRFGSNISLGVFNIVILNLLSEFMPVKNRSLILMINSGFYNFGNLFLILLNYYFIGSFSDNHINHSLSNKLDSNLNLQYSNNTASLNHSNNFDSDLWRIINLLTTIPALISTILIILYCYESPLYLLNKHNENDAFLILEKLCKRPLLDEEKSNIINSIHKKKNYYLNSDFKELFLNDYSFLTFSTLFICAISYFNMIGISFLVPKTLSELGEGKTYNLSYYSQLFIYGVLQLPNGFIGGWMTESNLFGRKRTIFITSLLCSVFYFISYFWPRYLCFYAGEIMLFNSIGFGVAFIYVTEVFPTNIRDQAQSFIQFFSFLLGGWSPSIINFFENKNILINFIILGFSYMICALVSFSLPIETKSRPLDED